MGDDDILFGKPKSMGRRVKVKVVDVKRGEFLYVPEDWHDIRVLVAAEDVVSAWGHTDGLSDELVQAILRLRDAVLSPE